MMARSSKDCTYFAVFAAGTGAIEPYCGAVPESFLNWSNMEAMLVPRGLDFAFGRVLGGVHAVSKGHGCQRHPRLLRGFIRPFRRPELLAGRLRPVRHSGLTRGHV